jgi:hypothetical protein
VNTRNTSVRQLATVFSHLIDGSCDSSPWAIVFFELLLHCQGLYLESEVEFEKKNIWCIDKEFQVQVEERLKIVRQNARKGRNAATPRKSVNRQSVLKGKPGVSLKRSLFKPKFSQAPASMNYLTQAPCFYRRLMGASI